MDDNCSPHCAHLVDDFILEEGIIRMVLPAYSSKICPINYVSHILGRRAASGLQPLHTFYNFERGFLDVWERLHDFFINSIIDTTPQKCSALLPSASPTKNDFNRYFIYFSFVLKS